jgi:hypothetical protein
MHKFEHALVVLRDLRRTRNDLLSPGHACHNDELMALDYIQAAIRAVKDAERVLAAKELTEANEIDTMVSDALRHIDWQRTA